jgi:hypothetical protein
MKKNKKFLKEYTIFSIYLVPIVYIYIDRYEQYFY